MNGQTIEEIWNTPHTQNAVDALGDTLNDLSDNENDLLCTFCAITIQLFALDEQLKLQGFTKQKEIFDDLKHRIYDKHFKETTIKHIKSQMNQDNQTNQDPKLNDQQQNNSQLN